MQTHVIDMVAAEHLNEVNWEFVSGFHFYLVPEWSDGAAVTVLASPELTHQQLKEKADALVAIVAERGWEDFEVQNDDPVLYDFRSANLNVQLR